MAKDKPCRKCGRKFSYLIVSIGWGRGGARKYQDFYLCDKHRNRWLTLEVDLERTFEYGQEPDLFIIASIIKARLKDEYCYYCQHFPSRLRLILKWHDQAWQHIFLYERCLRHPIIIDPEITSRRILP